MLPQHQYPVTERPARRGLAELGKAERIRLAFEDPLLIQRETHNRSLFEFFKYFWEDISNDELIPNWHIPYLCTQLEELALRVANKEPKLDLLINIAPGTTKTKLISVIFPVWCWTKYYWMKFITVSYSSTLALESAEESRDLVRCQRFRELYPELEIKDDKDTKGNFKLVKKWYVEGYEKPLVLQGGNRFSTSVGGTVTGFHAHIKIWDDPLNPQQAVSDVERLTANRYIDQTLSQRSTNKIVSSTIGVMQRLHKEDPSGHLLAKNKGNIKHICLPGEIRNYRELVKPQELTEYYDDDLFDVNRMPWNVLEDMMADLGQYGYAGQVGQAPSPPTGGMFKTDMFSIVHVLDPNDILKTIRFWDKAGTKEKTDVKSQGRVHTQWEQKWRNCAQVNGLLLM